MQNLQKPRQWTEGYFYNLPFPVSACPVVLKYILIAVFQGGIWRDWQDPIKANLAPELLSIKKIQHPQFPQNQRSTECFY